MIKPGVIVTAAHCVVKYGAGASGFYSDWQFRPAYHIGKTPYGVWYGFAVQVLSSYVNGTEPCLNGDAGCQNDIAVIAVSNKKLKKFPGYQTGWFSYAWDGYGFSNNFFNTVLKVSLDVPVTHISNLGYPANLDFSQQMQRNDSLGIVDTDNLNVTIIGSLMGEGSSGGPWIVNLGVTPELVETQFGLAPDYNVIVGVTSAGSVDDKIQVASPFTSTNIATLVNGVCTDASVPAKACNP